MSRLLGWFSCGAASAVAVKLTGAEPVYCEAGSEHPDNERFLADCERWFGAPVTRLRGGYQDTWEVWEKRRYLAMWGCKTHWFKLPQALRNRVWATYVPGQEITKTPSAEYLAVAHDVQAWITQRESQ
jgi:hypothetical protein